MLELPATQPAAGVWEASRPAPPAASPTSPRRRKPRRQGAQRSSPRMIPST